MVQVLQDRVLSRPWRAFSKVLMSLPCLNLSLCLRFLKAQVMLIPGNLRTTLLDQCFPNLANHPVALRNKNFCPAQSN